MLALASGIAPGVWAAENERTIVTALQILTKDDGAEQPAPIAEG